MSKLKGGIVFIFICIASPFAIIGDIILIIPTLILHSDNWEQEYFPLIKQIWK